MNELFHRNLENKNAKNSADYGYLVCEISDGSKDTTGSSVGRIGGVWSTHAEELALINKRPESLKQNLCFAWTKDTGHLGLKNHL